MFGKFFDYAKQLFNEDIDQPRDEPRDPRAPRQQENINRSQQPQSFSRSLVFDTNAIPSPNTPQQLWSREDLHLCLKDTKIEKCYDEKFRRGLVKFGQGTRYKEPNIELLRQYMLEMRDNYLIIISQKKNQQNFKEEMSRLQEEFQQSLYPLMTKHKDNSTAHLLITADIFKLLPMSFKTRNDDKLNDLIYKFYTYDKLIILKMTENRLQDSDSFRKTTKRFDLLHTESESYCKKVTQVRQNIAKMKQSVVQMKEQVIGKFNKKMKVQKVLYILEKIKSKYQKVINYCVKDLAETSMLNYPSLYQVFLIGMVNFKADSQKFTSLKLLRKYEEVVSKRLVTMKKRLKSEMYSELKMLSGNPKLKRTEKLGMLVDLHNKISDASKEVLGKSKVDGKLPKGLEFFDDSSILETHYNEIIAYNSQLDTERTKELIFGSVSSGGLDSRAPMQSTMPLNKATTNFGAMSNK